MNRLIFLIPAAFCLSCEEQKDEIVVTETRDLTTRDIAPLLDATSDQRFRDAKPSPVQGNAPENWLAKPSTQMRLLNYRFGQSGKGQVFVGLSGGGILPNCNRWLNEFGAKPIDSTGLAGLEKIQVAGIEGVLVTAQGTYSPGRGQAPAGNQGLAGIIVERNSRILTIKMVGPYDEVQKALPELRTFAAGLKWSADPAVSGP